MLVQAVPLGVVANTVALFPLQRSLADIGPTGFELLERTAQPVIYGSMLPGLFGAYFDGALYGLTTRGGVTPQPAALRLLGAMTVQLIAMAAYPISGPAAAQTLIGMTDDTEGAAADLRPWQIETAAARVLQGNWRHTFPGPVTVNVASSPPILPAYTPALITFTRAAAGAAQLYVNQTLVGSSAGPNTLPADASATDLTIGFRLGPATINAFQGWIASPRMLDVHRSAAEVRDDYNASLGLVLGAAP